jgi:CAAX protease family protein
MGSLSKFFVVTFAITWVGSAIAWNDNLWTNGSPLQLVRTLLLLAGTFAPAIAAIGLTIHQDGLWEIQMLLRRLIDARVPVRWYMFALGCVPAIYVAVAIVDHLSSGGSPLINRNLSHGVVMAMAIALPIQAGEEIGWRGYALPRLAKRFGFAGASLILGLIWASWHLPLFYVPSSSTYGQSFPVFVLLVIAISVAMTWLYANTNGSLLLAVLMHWAINQTGLIVTPPFSVPANPLALSRSPAEWMTVVLLWIAAAYFLVNLRKSDVPRGERQSVDRLCT